MLDYVTSIIMYIGSRVYINKSYLRLDRLAGSKALDPTYCRQPSLWFHILCQKVLTVHVNEFIWPRHSHNHSILMSRIWHGSSKFKVLSYDVVFWPRSEPITSHTGWSDKLIFLKKLLCYQKSVSLCDNANKKLLKKL